MNSKPLIYIIVGMVLGYAGFLLGLCLAFNGFENEFTTGNILQSVTTLVAAIIVSAVIQKRAQVELRKKELLVKQMELGLSKLLDLSALDFVAGNELVKVTSLLKQINLVFGSVSNACKNFGFNNVDFDFSAEIRELRKMTTDTPVQALVELAGCDGACSAEIKDNIIKLNIERSQQIQSHIQGMQTKVFDAQVKVLNT